MKGWGAGIVSGGFSPSATGTVPHRLMQRDATGLDE